MFPFYSGVLADKFSQLATGFAPQPGKIEQVRIKQMRWSGVHQRTKHHLPAAGAVGLPPIKNSLDLLALEPVLRAAQIAGNDGILHRSREFFAIRFGDMRERAVKKQIAFLVHQFRGHRSEPSTVKEVHEKCLEYVVAMMPQNDSGATFFAGDAVKMATAQTAAQRTEGPARRDLVHHDGVGVLILDPVGDAHLLKESGQYGRGKIRLPLIQIAGQNFDRQQPAPFQFMQDREQGIAVLAARQTDQPFAARFDHTVFFDRLAGMAHKPLAQLAKLGALRGPVKKRVNIVRLIQHGVGLEQLLQPIKRGMMYRLRV